MDRLVNKTMAKFKSIQLHEKDDKNGISSADHTDKDNIFEDINKLNNDVTANIIN